MKKILAVLTVIVMLGCMLSVTAFADGGYVPSPKHDDEPGTTPTSPQTGYDLGTAAWWWPLPSAAVWLTSAPKRPAPGHNEVHPITRSPINAEPFMGPFSRSEQRRNVL